MLFMRNNEAGMTLDSFEKEVLLAESARSKFLEDKLGSLGNLHELKLHNQRLERHVNALENSLSWKITAPVRRCHSVIKSLTPALKGKRDKINNDEVAIVTVICTTYNQSPEELKRAFSSVLLQTWTNLALLIWDDGSTSKETLDYLALIQKDYDARIQLYSNVNQGVVEARNQAAKKCKSKYILFLDPDDSIEYTYLEKAILVAESHPQDSLGVVQTDVFVIGHPKIQYWKTHELSWPQITKGNQVPICALIKRSAFEEVGGFATYMKSGFEDWDLWTRLASHGYVSKRIAEPLFNYYYQEEAGRYSFLKQEVVHNQLAIKASNPKKIKSKTPLQAQGEIPRSLLDHRLSIYNSENETVFIFVPWLTETGGAEAFLKSLAKDFVSNGRTVCFVSTLYGFESPSTKSFLNVTPYVYDVTKFVSEANALAFVNNLLSRTSAAIVINSGSSWLYENLKTLMTSSDTSIRAFDILYNSVGHLPNFIQNQDLFTGVIPVYENLGRVLSEHFKVSPKVTTIPVGINDAVHPSEKLPAERFSIGWLGRLSPEKRPDWFVRISTELEELADFQLGGEGQMHGELMRSLTNTRENRSGLRILGKVEDGYEFMRSLDLLINTSSTEGISVTAMEAISLGIPVISPKIGGMEELIMDGINGYLYEPDDFQALISTVKRLVETPGELARLQASTMETRLPEKFRVEAMVQAYEDLFSDKS